MNTTLKVTIAIVAVIAVVAVLGTGFAFAQGLTPWGGYGMTGNQVGMMSGYTAQNGTPVPGYGMMSGQGGLGMMGASLNGIDMNTMHQWMSDTGGMHAIVWGGLAEALNLTPDELNTQLASGQTLAQIAEAQGVSQEQLTTALETSMKAGLDQAVADGVFTREQADQMLTQMSGQYQWMITQMGAGMGFGNGNCHGTLAQPNNP